MFNSSNNTRIIDSPTGAEGPSREEIVNAIESLGKTSEEIAHSLENLGITGIPCNSWECPLAHFLCERFPDCPVMVGPDLIKVNNAILRSDRDFLYVSTFVSDVDQRKYPKLMGVLCKKCGAGLTQDDLDEMGDLENPEGPSSNCPYCPVLI